MALWLGVFCPSLKARTRLKASSRNAVCLKVSLASRYCFFPVQSAESFKGYRLGGKFCVVADCAPFIAQSQGKNTKKKEKQKRVKDYGNWSCQNNIKGSFLLFLRDVSMVLLYILDLRLLYNAQDI